MALIIYKVFTDSINANLTIQFLEEAGINCFLADENMTTLSGGYNASVGGIKLKVEESYVERVNELMKEFENK